MNKLKVLLLTIIALVSLGFFTTLEVDAKQLSLGKAKNGVVTEAEKRKFFEKYGDYASELSAKNNFYASVMLSQMALESNYGRSALAQSPSHNFFGIKGSYNNNYVVKSTKEYNAKGKAYTTNAKFKAYSSYKTGMDDYVSVIKKGIYYKAWVSNTKSYKDSTKALQGTYATDVQYANKLNKIIKDYNLTKYDKISHKNYVSNTSYVSHSVKKGEYLSKIANQYGTTVANIKSWNNLKSNNLSVGQKLKIKKTTVVYVAYK